MKKTSAIVPRASAGVPAAALPLMPSRKMVASVFAELPPTLPAGVSERAWLTDASEFIGEHPDPVLVSAREAIMSKFAFAPKKAEIISEILAAYLRLGVSLSPDALKHASFRKKLPARYAISDRGTKRFADDAKVVTVGFVVVHGPQVNIILDELPEAKVEDVEKAIQGVHRAFGGADRVSGDDVLDRLRTELFIQVAYRNHGTPTDLCGGVVGQVGTRNRLFECASTWLALSQTFVDRMRDTYPHARTGTDSVHWGEAMRESFQGVAHRLDAARYGTPEFQAEAEAAIARAMADLDRSGRVEIATSRKFVLRQIDTAMSVIGQALVRLKAGGQVGDSVTVGQEALSLRTLAECETARAKATVLREKINAEITALQGAA